MRFATEGLLGGGAFDNSVKIIQTINIGTF